MEEMKKAKEKWLIKGRREKEEQEFHHKRKEAHKIIRNKKKTYMKNVIESIEEVQKDNNTRKMYQTVNQFKKGHQNKVSIIRNKKGELALNTKEKAEIWKVYFDRLLNTEEPRELIKKRNKEVSEAEVEELTIEDVKMAIKNLKNNKAAGTDGIHPELIKYRGNKLLNRMYVLALCCGIRGTYKREQTNLFINKMPVKAKSNLIPLLTTNRVILYSKS